MSVKVSVINITLALSTAIFSFAVPIAKSDLDPLKFTPGNFTAMMESADTVTSCPSTGTSCGVVNFESGQYVSFGQGVCMQLGKNVQSIYVARCFCSLWSSCTGNSKKDAYVKGMMLCEKPKGMSEFDQEVKYISCGGMH